MKRTKHYILLFIALAGCGDLFAQKDSVQALFQPPKFNIHYSYLQWELGYNGFVFSGNNYIDGVGFDGIGVVFNDDIDVALGLDQGGRPYNNYRGFALSSFEVQSYAGFYLKIEPLLFPEKVINLSMPIKLDISSLSYSDTGTVTYGGKHHHQRPLIFPAVIPGVFGWVNIFPKVSLGVGVSYRIALETFSPLTGSDYSNFMFSGMVRLKLFTRSHTKQAAKENNYAAPANRFQ